MSDRSDRDRRAPSSDRDRRAPSLDPMEGPTLPRGAVPKAAPKANAENSATKPYLDAAPDSGGEPSPRLRRSNPGERKETLRDLAVPAPNRQPTQPYLDRLPPSDPPPPPTPTPPSPQTTPTLQTTPTPSSAADPVDLAEDPTQLRISTEPVTFYIDRDSVPSPSDPSAADALAFDSAPTRELPSLDEATTQIKAKQRPSAMNLGKLASPRYGGVGEPVRIATGKPSAMRLNRVEALLNMPGDSDTDAPVETPGDSRVSRNSLSGQRLHRALPVITGLAFLAIGAAITVALSHNPAKAPAPAPSTTSTLTTTATLAPRTPATLPTSVATSTTSPPAPTQAPTTQAPTVAPSPPAAPPPPPAADSAPAPSPAPAPLAPTAASTPRKKAPSRSASPSSPSPKPTPKSQGDGLGELPF